MSFRKLRHAASVVVLAVFSLFVPSRAHAERTSATDEPIDRATVLALAVRAHPVLRAGQQRANAARRRGEAAGSLPSPEAMMQIWQVPVAKPYAIGDAQMIMFGVGQSFPAPGSRGARERAAGYEADAERALTADRQRQIRREVDHAFTDYVEATSRHRIHLEHRRVAIRAVDVARARHAGGGSLADVAQMEVELARVDADVVTDGTRVEAARRRLNALLGREPLAPLGPPVTSEPEVAAWDTKTALTVANERRPEIKAATALRQARGEEANAAATEAVIPAFSVAGLYFAPTSSLPQHGYGVNASMSLPWLWGGEARSRRDAFRESEAAATSDTLAARIPIAAEVAKQEAEVRAGALRLSALRDRARPASRRAFDVAWSGYEASRIDILTLISTQRSVVDVESEIVMARALLDHALADLEAAVGSEVPRRPLGAFDPKVLEEGADAHVIQ